jgi:uncharacterized protein (DUF433 family)
VSRLLVDELEACRETVRRRPGTLAAQLPLVAACSPRQGAAPRRVGPFGPLTVFRLRRGSIAFISGGHDGRRGDDRSCHLPSSPVRGLRIRVTDVLDLLASGLSSEQVLEELPDLEADDVSACLRFASRRLDHPIVVTL